MRLLRNILRRSPFPGQSRIFYYLFSKGSLKDDYVTTTPTTGNFMIYVNTKNLIDASIVYMGDYEPEVKKIFKSVIKQGNVVLDIGANIGFHSLYFSELVGEKGKVISFEPVLANYNALTDNIKLNACTNIIAKNTALGEKQEQKQIFVDENSNNPGSYNLFSQQSSNTFVDCRVGDECISEMSLDHIDFMKIDVEGYELFVLKGLSDTIKKYKPKIVFEYDSAYQLRTSHNVTSIFDFLQPFGYSFYIITPNGLKKYSSNSSVKSADIYAIPEFTA